MLFTAAVGCFLFDIAAPLVTLCWPHAKKEEEEEEEEGGGLSSSGGGDGGSGWLAKMHGTPDPSATELLRVCGLLGPGVLGAVFVPDCVVFRLGGEERAWPPRTPPEDARVVPGEASVR